ncbi:DUF397 domain-containing protein [Streptomyces olivoreticuli]|uniref:DUF397 domain-containing protein n=1 Tax=Streptomyces olivoreticuli TaxID=68246 RepID=UPI000E254ECC|nr:DUF397 domain-containing protein [Streptomyces olivoreticuli]
MDHKEDLYGLDLCGATWRKSPDSNGGQSCVEITDLPDGGMAVRDSKNPERPDLRYTADEWAAFRSGIINGTL